MKRREAFRVIIVAIVAIILTSVWMVHTNAKSAQVITEQQAVVSKKPILPTRSELLALVNAEREKNNVAPLVESPLLDKSAQMKADDETTYNYFGHISPSSSPNAGKDSHGYIFSTGISCLDSSENLTENIYVNDAQHAVSAWINSPAHHAAMIDSKYSLTGFGISGNEVVEHFCQTN